MAIDRFDKQPADVQDYDIDFGPYLTSQSDTPLSFVATAETGITIVSSALTGNVVKVLVGGGTDGNRYKVSVTMTTTGGRVKQHDILIRVKEL